MNTIKPAPAVTLNRAHALAGGLAGAWLLNEGCGVHAGDCSGFGRHGALVNMEASDWVGSPFGGSLDFGGDDRVTVSGGTLATLEGDGLTVAALATSDLAAGTFGRLVDRVYNGQFALYYNHAAGYGLAFALATAGGSVDVPNPNVFHASAGAPFLAALTYDGSAARLYADGRLAYARSAGLGGSLLSSSADLHIGNRANGDRPFDGRIHAAWIWTRALCLDEVRLMQADPFGMFRRPASMATRCRPQGPTGRTAWGYYRRMRCS